MTTTEIINTILNEKESAESYVKEYCCAVGCDSCRLLDTPDCYKQIEKS